MRMFVPRIFETSTKFRENVSFAFGRPSLHDTFGFSFKIPCACDHLKSLTLESFLDSPCDQYVMGVINIDNQLLVRNTNNDRAFF